MLNNKRLLFITSSNLSNPRTGAEYTSNRNYTLVKALIKTDLLLINKEKIGENYFIPSGKNKLQILFYTLQGRINYHKKYEKVILKIIRDNKYDVIFLDSSLFGFLCEKIKLSFSNIKIITFFHNIEYNYSKEMARLKRKIHYLTWIVSYFNEKKIIKNSNKIIVLNERENKELKKIYKREADYILSLSFKDEFDKEKIKNNRNLNYLFLGTNFYANYEGIKWFIDNVASELDGNIYVVGKDFEKVRKELEILPNVKVIGTVDKTEEWYYKIPIVISPIFSGAGMKTKTAEALMYGKYIFGTTEAFEGYNLEYDKVGGLCNTSEEFIKKIKNKTEEIKNKNFNNYSREQYLKYYSWQQTKNKIKEILNEI